MRIERRVQEAGCHGGGIFVPVALWRNRRGGLTQGVHGVDGEDGAVGTRRRATRYSWDERFEHPARTWASASHRSFTLQSVGIAMAKASTREWR